jgi:thioredoxin 1
MKSKILVGLIVVVVIIAVIFVLTQSGQEAQKTNSPQNDSTIIEKDYASPTGNQGIIEDKTENGSIIPKDNPTLPKNDEQAFCIQDAKLCPDGSYVGRVPPTCEFAACPAAQTKGAYVEYSPAALATATQNGKAVLFFHAKWCPFCKSANAAFSSRESEIPSGVTVLKTDYDTEKDLKTKYGVTYQHTFVQVDAQGNMVTKWNGGDIDSLKANLK